MLRTHGSVPFLFGKDGSGVLANCSVYGTEATLFFSAGPVCSGFSNEACAILHALCWSWQPQQVCHFSFPPIWLSLCPFLHLSFYLSLWQEMFFSSPVLSGYNGSPDTRFSRASIRLMSWPDGERYLFPQQSLVVSLLLPLVFTLLFCRTGGILSHLNSSTHRLPRFPPRNLRFYVMFAVFSLAFAATDTIFC